MDPYSGRVYEESEIPSLSREVKDRLVKVEGPPRSIRRLSQATKHYSDVTGKDISKRRKANKRARKARRLNR